MIIVNSSSFCSMRNNFLSILFIRVSKYNRNIVDYRCVNFRFSLKLRLARNIASLTHQFVLVDTRLDSNACGYPRVISVSSNSEED